MPDDLKVIAPPIPAPFEGFGPSLEYVRFREKQAEDIARARQELQHAPVILSPEEQLRLENIGLRERVKKLETQIEDLTADIAPHLRGIEKRKV